jgi:hypothetical protein
MSRCRLVGGGAYRKSPKSSGYEPVDPVIAGTFVGIAKKEVDILLNVAVRVSDTT